MLAFKNNAKTREDVDLSLLELEAILAEDALSVVYSFDRLVVDLAHGSDESRARHRVLERSAYVICDSSDVNMLSQWSKIASTKPDGVQDHSTHNLFPFEGKCHPQLARALINICVGTRADARILDPFCGSGTILLEADLLGFESVGCDVDSLAVFISSAKLASKPAVFEDAVDRLAAASGQIEVAPLLAARKAAPPSGRSAIYQIDAVHFLRDTKLKFDAIVTSPPYFDAIDYAIRSIGLRRILNLPPPSTGVIGVQQSVEEYHNSIKTICRELASVLKPAGRIAIIIADHENVPSSLWYELALKTAGLERYLRYQRSYPATRRGISSETLLVMQKVNGYALNLTFSRELLEDSDL